MNNETLESWVLFENGGNYDKDEIKWYQDQMDKMNELVEVDMNTRLEKVTEFVEEIDRLKDEPDKEFTE